MHKPTAKDIHHRRTKGQAHMLTPDVIEYGYILESGPTPTVYELSTGSWNDHPLKLYGVSVTQVHGDIENDWTTRWDERSKVFYSEEKARDYIQMLQDAAV